MFDRRKCSVAQEFGVSEEGGFFDGALLDLIDDIEVRQDVTNLWYVDLGS